MGYSLAYNYISFWHPEKNPAYGSEVVFNSLFKLREAGFMACGQCHDILKLILRCHENACWLARFKLLELKRFKHLSRKMSNH